MKKNYEKPVTISYDLEHSAFPAALAGGAAIAAGYAIGRSVANMVKAAPVIKLKELSR